MSEIDKAIQRLAQLTKESQERAKILKTESELLAEMARQELESKCEGPSWGSIPIDYFPGGKK